MRLQDGVSVKINSHKLRLFALLYVVFTMLAANCGELAPYREVVEDRLLAEYGGQPTLWSADCSDARINLNIDSESFNRKYPIGVLVVCNEASDTSSVRLVVMRYLFNASKRDVALSSFVNANLSRRGNAWHIDRWRVSHREYAS